MLEYKLTESNIQLLERLKLWFNQLLSISEQGDMKHSNFQILSNIHFINHEL